MNPGELLLYVLVAVAVWAFVSLRLMQAMQPLRLELARRGEVIFARKDLPTAHRKLVQFMLDEAYSGWVLLVAIFMYPLIVIVFSMDSKFRARSAAAWRIADKSVREDIENLDRLFTLSVSAASPISAALFWIERAVLATLLAILAKPLDYVGIAFDQVLNAYDNYGKPLRNFR